MYATTGNAINIVTNGSGAGIEKGDHIYYGTKTDAYVYKESGDGDGTDPYWRVLDASKDNAGNSKAMFVMAESLWGTGDSEGNVYFKHNEPYSNAWQGSDAQRWCGTFRDALFSSNEKSAIKNVSKHDDPETLYGFNWDESSLSNEKVFFLSVKEVYDYISKTEGDALKAKYNGTDRRWWLRSPYNGVNMAGHVYYDGSVDFNNVNTGFAARPALNIDLESVILTSAAEGGKNPGTGGDGTLNSVDSGEVSKWKLTVLDSSRNGFTASAPKADCTAPEGYTSWTVPVTYSNAKSGLETEHVSAILTDSDGNALYYGHIATNSADGTKDLTIPTGLPKGTYTLNVFSEQVNGDKKTDYASPLKTITLTITEAPTEQVETPTFSPAAGTYTEARNVEISCATEGATIHYTTDGTAPTADSSTYISPINVSGTTTIKAIAVKTGMTDSSVASARYTISKDKPKPDPKEDDDDDEEENKEPEKPAAVNPDTVEGFFAVSGQPVPGVAMGKTVQGVAAQAVFNATRPAGFLQAFTFNMAINGKVDYTPKNGALTIIIPKEYRKAGRTFAIMALDKNGKAWTFADTDTNPNTVTATINVEGYAFALIYKD